MKALFLSILFISIWIGSFGQDIKKISDSLIGVLTSAKHDTLKVKAATMLQKIVYKTDPDSTIHLAKHWLPFAIKLKMQKEEAFMYWLQGQAYKSMGISDSAIALHLKGLKLRDKINDKTGIVDSHNGLGQTYMLIMNYDKSVETFLEGAKYARENGDKRGLAAILSNLSGCYREMKKNDLALSAILESIALKKEIGNIDSYYTGLFNLANVYGATGRMKSSDSCFQLCLEYGIKRNDIEMQATVYNNLGRNFNKEKKFNEAIAVLKKAEELSKDIKHIDLQRRIKVGFNDAYYGLGMYKEAYVYLREFNDLDDSLMRMENLKQVKEMEAKYHGEKKQKEIELLNKDKLLQDGELAKRKNMIIFFSILIILFLILTVIIVKNNIQRKKSNKLLMKLNHEILEQKNEVEHQKNIIDEKNTEITDSIRYAKRLQQAILPPLNYLKEHAPETFVLYKPKDIVAGDFYWADEKNGVVLIAAADCTGHGVPGAMVSVVCSNALNRTVNEFGITETGAVLDKTTELVLETFARSGEEIKDGMDISLISINRNTQKINWSGANNPLVYLREGQLYEVAADKQPVGKHENRKPFVTHSFEYRKGDTYFLFTDGFADQFGGPKGKKFKFKQFTELLLQNSELELSEVHEKLSKAFEDWKGKIEQLDDVTVIGLRL
ncbi:MAG TPA: SpoIIE family protein phosphatase [Bacteroidia bacterium]|nr:SpoIIE family protein phosphatase [Bacteroidia bacterium]